MCVCVSSFFFCVLPIDRWFYFGLGRGGAVKKQQYDMLKKVPCFCVDFLVSYFSRFVVACEETALLVGVVSVGEPVNNHEGRDVIDHRPDKQSAHHCFHAVSSTMRSTACL